MKSRALLVALLMFSAAPVRADDISRDLACEFRHPVVEIESVDSFPNPVRAFLRAKLGEMAKRGAYFNATDVITQPAPSRRFIRAGRSGDIWFLWYEHGGIAYNRNIVLLAWRRADAAPRLVTIASYAGNPCSQTDAFLDGRLPAQPSGWW